MLCVIAQEACMHECELLYCKLHGIRLLGQVLDNIKVQSPDFKTGSRSEAVMMSGRKSKDCITFCECHPTRDL